ncbi:serine peptidase [Mangrovihabitans endophyticus]|uniref:Serine peptidase n=1 Tax=Mangrovihabitans endophyticus TaxID=1751298 RepID=A0A8J3C7I1_9ACTN|nr:serine peptidase [Mangrovihabitans endophyticus]GGL16593.1 hypothetical protein GCM10012284_58980 [Mangrovihabitans endophyticus]
MTTILGIHGAGNHRAGQPAARMSAALSERWAAALGRGLGAAPGSLDLDVVYYADLLHGEIAQGPPEVSELGPVAEAMVLAWTQALGAPPDIAQGRLTEPARRAIEWVAQRFGRPYEVVAHAFVAVVFPEVATYLTDEPAREAVRETVAQAIAEHRPAVLIAHSLGSVVAYEALCAHPGIEVPLLLTVGSPLGMPKVVRERLRPAVGPDANRPAGVRRWVNVADHGDFITVPTRLSDVFAVDEEHRVSIHPVDFHRVASYLPCPEVSAAVRPYLSAFG